MSSSAGARWLADEPLRVGSEGGVQHRASRKGDLLRPAAGSRGNTLGIVSKVGSDGVGRRSVEVVPSPVVAPGGARVGMAGGILHISQGHAGVEGQSHERMAQAVGAEPVGAVQPGVSG
jgi:hypothetical protein